MKNPITLKLPHFKRLLAVALLVVAAASCAEHGGKNAHPATFTNPVIKGYFSDPSILRDGEDYYAIMSSHPYYPAMTVWHSRDLVNWNPVCYTLDTYMGSIWAPDLIKHDGTYYIYFTNRQFPGDPYPSGNYVIHAPSIEGPWSAPVDLKVPGIDPGHVFDVKTGERYIYLSGGRMCKLSADGLTVISPVEIAYDGWEFPDEWDVQGFALEGPKFFHKEGYYYAVWAEGGTHGPATSHMAVVARATEVTGPWENSPYNPVVHTYDPADRWWSKGHGTIFQTHLGDWFILYHAYEKDYLNLGRQAILEPIVWTSDGWPVLKKGSDPAKPIAWPIPGAKSPEYFIGDHLNEFRVGYEWWFHEEFDPERFSVQDNSLTLRARGESPGTDSNPLVFNAGEHAYSVSLRVRKTPDAHAGLICYYDNRAFVGVGVDGSGVVRYRYGETNPWAQVTVKDPTDFYLKLINRHHAVTVFVGDDGTDWRKLQTGFYIESFEHNMLFGSKACLPGVFVSGAGEATFSDVRFEVLQ